MKTLIKVSGDAGGATLIPHINQKYTRKGFINLADMYLDGIKFVLDYDDCTNWKLIGAFVSQPENKLITRFEYRWQRHQLECNVPVETVYMRGWIESAWDWLWR